MEENEIEKFRYPIGKFEKPANIEDEVIDEWIETLDQYPRRLRELVSDLNDEQLNTPYRPGGWTVRQLVHHISDSHHNSYIRFKWALTEETPVIKVYDEKKWAELHDTRSAPISMSLDHLSAVHAKLVYLLRGLNKTELKKAFIHPDGHVETSLEENIGRYVWHGNHHYTHIANLIARNSWA